MASPFKTKNIEETVNSKDIKSLMEQNNYTNNYLQVIGEKLTSKHSSQTPSSTSQPKKIEKPLFKPFKITKQLKKDLQMLNPQTQIKKEILSGQDEFL